MPQEITNDKGEKMEVYTKEELQVEQAKSEKLAKDLEDTRMEVLSPEYTRFLESLEKEQKPKEKDDKGKEKSGVLTPDEILEKATNNALQRLKDEQAKEREAANVVASKKQKETIAKFAKDHDDFETYRPIMLGLSNQVENQDLTLEQLYNKSKEHIKTIKTGASEADKEKQRKLKNEKPEGDSEAFKRLKSMSPEAVAREALAEVEATLGPIPSA